MHRAQILHYASLSLAFAFLIFIIFNLLFGSQEEVSLNWALGLVILSQVLVQYLMRSGSIKRASLFELSIIWIVLTIISHGIGGMRDVAVLGYILIFLGAGILLGWIFAAGYTLASIVAIWWLAYLEANGILTPHFGYPYRVALDLTVVLVLILLVEIFLIRSLTSALEKAQFEIQEREQTQMVLEYLANTDVLTGIPNRRHFFDLAKKEFAAATRYQRSLSIAMLDIDEFKMVNDTYGHLAGDQAFIHVSQILRDLCREADTVARFGGDELVMLLPETNCTAAFNLAERLREAVETQPMGYGGEFIHLTLSIGVASKKPDEQGVDLDRLLSRADQAMYKAKQSGKNQVFCCDADTGVFASDISGIR